MAKKQSKTGTILERLNDELVMANKDKNFQKVQAIQKMIAYFKSRESKK